MHHLQLAAGIVYRGWAHVECHNVVRVKPRSTLLRFCRVREQACAHQQQAREPDLHRHENLAQPHMPVSPVMSPASSERQARRNPRTLKCRNNAEEKCREQCDPGRERRIRKSGEVEGIVGGAGRCVQAPDHPRTEQQPRDTARAAGTAFSIRNCRINSPAGAQRGPDGDFSLARRARQVATLMHAISSTTPTSA
jgi:hypothetical protein